MAEMRAQFSVHQSEKATRDAEDIAREAIGKDMHRAGIFSRWTNQTQVAQAYSHDGAIGDHLP
eukprot:1184084-Prorocentrum_minimum.AAC.2